MGAGTQYRGMPPDSMYQWLVERGDTARCGADDIHVLACLLTIAWGEAIDHDQPWRTGLGLDQQQLTGLLTSCFPAALPVLADSTGDRNTAVHSPAPELIKPELAKPELAEPELAEDELAVRDLLWMHAGTGSVLQRLLSVIVAKRCSQPRHLWQDLGLRNRDELSALMRRHFPRLFERNYQNMKWKKFFFRLICQTEGFSLCVAPVCSDCDDFDACFGAEDGPSVLAHIRAGRVMAV